MIKIKRKLTEGSTRILLCENIDQLRSYKDEIVAYWIILQKWMSEKSQPSYYYVPTSDIFIVTGFSDDNQPAEIDYQYCQTLDAWRRLGGKLCSALLEQKSSIVAFDNLSGQSTVLYSILEGIVLADYNFGYYFSASKKNKSPEIKELQVLHEQITPTSVSRLNAISTAVNFARDLVNEPPNILTATELSSRIKSMAKESKLRCQILDKHKIEQLNMGGLLAVNKGSVDEPTFTIIEHIPLKAINKNPIVIVGKGVVYDTGGLSLKPTPNSMDKMKSDMAGAAVVAGIMNVIGELDLPIHVVGLIPATDNRPGGEAYTPGDIVTMHSGHTVEVLNTDAEGRMILADAIHYAKRFSPMMIADFATLTGAAAAAIGPNALVAMGNVPQKEMQKFINCGYLTNEKVAQMPFWDEYAEYITSPIADMKNIGGPVAGAITAGKFLEKYTDYPFVHFDIAGVSFSDKKTDYCPQGGTGFGIRMMMQYLFDMCK